MHNVQLCMAQINLCYLSDYISRNGNASMRKYALYLFFCMVTDILAVVTPIGTTIHISPGMISTFGGCTPKGTFLKMYSMWW